MASSKVTVCSRFRLACLPERLFGQGQHHDRVLAAGEQQHRPLELGPDLAHDMDGLGLEDIELRHLIIRTHG